MGKMKKKMVKCLMLIFIMFWVTMNKNCAISEPLAYIDVDCPVYARVTATAYTACATECDSEPQINAAGKKPKAGDIGISRDMECNFSMGDTVYLIDSKGNIYEKKINDRMSKRYRRYIDVLVGTKKEAKEWGVQRGGMWKQ